jgi:hypothetical protein
MKRWHGLSLCVQARYGFLQAVVATCLERQALSNAVPATARAL